MLDFRVKTFLTVCDTMNFTIAAKQLNLTQPAVSQHIHFLEEQYQTSLFSYQNKLLSLTPTGEILKKYLSTLQNDENRILEEIKKRNSKIESLSLGVTKTIGEFAIIHPLSNYIKNHPSTNLHLHYGNTQELLHLLDRGKIQMAFVEGNYPKENYYNLNFKTEDYIAICSSSHSFIHTPHTLQDLTNECLLLREKGSGTRNILEQSLLCRGLDISDFTHSIEIENMHTIIDLLKEDCGISFLYKIAVEKELKNKQLKQIHLDDFKMQHDFDIIWEKHSIFTQQNLLFIKEFIG